MSVFARHSKRPYRSIILLVRYSNEIIKLLIEFRKDLYQKLMNKEFLLKVNSTVK